MKMKAREKPGTLAPAVPSVAPSPAPSPPQSFQDLLLNPTYTQPRCLSMVSVNLSCHSRPQSSPHWAALASRATQNEPTPRVVSSSLFTYLFPVSIYDF